MGLADMANGKFTSHEDARAQFEGFLHQAGFDLSRHDVIADGKWHNVPLIGQRDGKSGGYRLFLDERPYGQIKNHKTQELASWKPQGQNYRVTPQDAARFEQQRKAAQQTREQLAVSQAEIARRMWGRAQEADRSHPYLMKKGINPNGLRQLGDRLMIPLIDPKDGLIHNLQFISPAGEKRPLPGARKTGLLHVVGEIAPGRTIGVAEGFATAATLHEALGIPVAMTIDSGNMVAAAKALRNRYPDANMVVYGDNDWTLPLRNPPLENVGREAAHAASHAIGARVSIPPAMEGVSDYNDLGRESGKSTLRLLLTPRQVSRDRSLTR